MDCLTVKALPAHRKVAKFKHEKLFSIGIRAKLKYFWFHINA